MVTFFIIIIANFVPLLDGLVSSTGLQSYWAKEKDVGFLVYLSLFLSWYFVCKDSILVLFVSAIWDLEGPGASDFYNFV